VIYQRLLTSALWIAPAEKGAIVAGISGKSPPVKEAPSKNAPSKGPPPFDAFSNTLWAGWETGPADRSDVVFEFAADGSVVKTNDKVRVVGAYAVASDGLRFTMQFPGPKFAYAGSIMDAKHTKMVATGRSVQNLSQKGWSMTIFKKSGATAATVGRLPVYSGTGTGTLVDRKHRLVLTNAHVVRDRTTLWLHFPAKSGEELLVKASDYGKRAGIRGKVVLKENRADLALIQLEELPAGVSAIALSPSPAETSQRVRSLGNTDTGALWAFALGKVRDRSRGTWQVFDPFANKSLQFDAMKIETDTALVPGDSGGPLVDDRGVLVGVAQGSNILAANTSLFIDVTECATLLEKYYQTIGETPVATSEAANPADIARLPSLLKNLQDKDSAVRLQAVQAIGKLGSEAAIAFAKVFPMLKDDDAVLRRAASDALEKIPPHKADTQMLLRLFRDADESTEVRLQALKALGRLGVGPDVKEVPFLGKSLESSDPEMRRLAAEGLLRLGPLAKPAMPAVLVALKLPDKLTRVAALRVLGAIGPGARGEIPTLVSTLKDADRTVGVAAAQALIQLGETKDAISFLGETVKNGPSAARTKACLALAGLGADAKLAVNELILALNDSQARPAASEALVKIGKPAAEVISKKIAKTVRNDKARLACIEILGQIGHTSKSVVSALRIVYANDPQQENREAAYRVMQKLLGKG
jgi:HEAT repeat protein/S1-C subfamily serine protease